jgi:RNA polymerase sigma factor for flagellar operon FliA
MASTLAPDAVATRESLILENLKQVRGVARQIHRSLPPNVPLDDLISVGILGLINAIDHYDAGQNTKFSTYAEFKIRGAILDSLRSLDWAPRLQRRKAKQIEAAIFTAQNQLMRTPTDEDIAAVLGIKLEEYYQWLIDVQALNLGSLETEKNDGSSSHSLLNYIADDETRQPAALLERGELEQVLTEGVERLPEIERTVLGLYYEKELAPREIAEVIDLRAARVCQLRTQAILRLRSYFNRRLAARKRTK